MMQICYQHAYGESGPRVVDSSEIDDLQPKGGDSSMSSRKVTFKLGSEIKLDMMIENEMKPECPSN